MKHLDYCTHIKYENDRIFLTRKGFDVNMRLFNSSKQYKELILNICEYIKFLCSTKKEGYSKPRGFSGANAGFPLNIIAFDNNSNIEIMINPIITKLYGKKIKVKSNCGSLTLQKNISIIRSEFLDIKFYDVKGRLHKKIKIRKEERGFTIQHEVNHNNGILIIKEKRE